MDLRDSLPRPLPQIFILDTALGILRAATAQLFRAGSSQNINELTLNLDGPNESPNVFGFEFTRLRRGQLVKFICDCCVLVIDGIQAKLDFIEQPQEQRVIAEALELRITIA